MTTALAIIFGMALAFVFGVGFGQRWEGDNWANGASSGIRKEHRGKLYCIKESEW